MKQQADSYQVCRDISLGLDDELIRFFLDLDLIFKVNAGLKLSNLSKNVFVYMIYHEPVLKQILT